MEGYDITKSTGGVPMLSVVAEDCSKQLFSRCYSAQVGALTLIDRLPTRTLNPRKGGSWAFGRVPSGMCALKKGGSRRLRALRFPVCHFHTYHFNNKSVFCGVLFRPHDPRLVDRLAVQFPLCMVNAIIHALRYLLPRQRFSSACQISESE